MKRRVFLSGALAVAATPALARPPMQLLDTPRELLSPPFIDAEGRRRTLADFRGRIVLLNVWATWCVPCREEMPTLDALQERLGGPEFHVLPLSIDAGGRDVVRQFYDEIGIRNLQIYLGEGLHVQFAFAVFGFPTTLLINREGREIARRVGPAIWDAPDAIAQFETVIAQGGQ